MFQGFLVSFKQLFYSLWITILTLIGFSPIPAEGVAKQIITDPAYMIQQYRGAYVASVKDIESRYTMGFWGGATAFELMARTLGYSKQDIENAKIARRFFDSKKAVPIARSIGSIPADIEYIRTIFEEFFAQGPYNFDRLIAIMHKHTIKELELDPSTTIAQFRNIMEAKNKRGRYKYIYGAQFDTYARLIALNLFVKYWYDSHIKNKAIH